MKDVESLRPSDVAVAYQVLKSWQGLSAVEQSNLADNSSAFFLFLAENMLANGSMKNFAACKSYLKISSF